MFTVEEALCSVIWYSAVDGYAERDNRDAFTRDVYREATATTRDGGSRRIFIRPMHAHLLNRNNIFLIESIGHMSARV